jgi:hypothetical protein
MKRSKRINSSSAPKPSRPKRAKKRQTVAELRALQSLMTQAVMRPLTATERMRSRWIDGRATKAIAASFIKPNSRLTSFDRLEIYNRQYWLRVSECFYDDYPGLRAVLGEARFHNLAIAYLVNHPSSRFTLRDLGSELANFMQVEPRWTAPDEELALDMARLEWAHIEAFDNEAKPPVTLADLSHAPVRIRLRLQPHITLLKLEYPLDEFLLSLREQPGLRGEASNAIAADQNTGETNIARGKIKLPKRQPIRLAVHRHENVVYYKRLQVRQYDLLNALKRGASLQQALQTLPTTSAPPPVQDWFRNWAGLGWFWVA